MNWSDEGFLLSKNKYNENSLIVEIFTKEKGKVSGIIFGGTSKKIKNYLSQPYSDMGPFMCTKTKIKLNLQIIHSFSRLK